jgi:hypothetical protein
LEILAARGTTKVRINRPLRESGRTLDVGPEAEAPQAANENVMATQQKRIGLFEMILPKK